jgi:hypothetical protein
VHAVLGAVGRDVREERRMSEKELDQYRRIFELAQEEYAGALDLYEFEHGEEAREAYEEKYA